MAKKRKKDKKDWIKEYLNAQHSSNFCGPIGSTAPGVPLGASSGFPSLLPIAMKVAAKTIGQDIVAVKPMSAPLGQVYYGDYSYQRPLTDIEQLALDRMRELTGHDWYLKGDHEERVIQTLDIPTAQVQKVHDKMFEAGMSLRMEKEKGRYKGNKTERYWIWYDECTLLERGERLGDDTGIL